MKKDKKDASEEERAFSVYMDFCDAHPEEARQIELNKALKNQLEEIKLIVAMQPRDTRFKRILPTHEI